MFASLEEPWYLPTLRELLLEDCTRVAGISPRHVIRDIQTLNRRVAAEGESFLTKTLPAFCKAFDLALQSKIPLRTRAFKKARGTARPQFLGALLQRIFDDRGYLLCNPCVVSIRLVRQISGWFKKVEKGFTDESVREAVNDFVSVDNSLPDPTRKMGSSAVAVAKALIESIIRGLPDITQWKPKHGPGSVHCDTSPIGKRLGWRQYTDLISVFRSSAYFFLKRTPQFRHKWYAMRTQYGLSKFSLVEKDSGGPRTIGLEPAEYMWCQQALKGALYRHVEKHKITKGRVNFTDQSINQRKAAEWSDWETLDMSKASDRVSLSLVRTLFEKTAIMPALEACRTPGTLLPDGRVLFYRKFAPMGSAVCFPIEALCFYALACAALHLQGMPLHLATRSVYVYGDDLIVPRGYYPGLRDVFEACSLKFNEDKCCIHGKFRETCGADMFDGNDVSITRLKKAYPNVEDPPTFIPLIKHANRLFINGYWSAARSFRVLVQQRFPGVTGCRSGDFWKRIPVHNTEDVPILSWLDSSHTTLRLISKSNGMDFVRGWVFEPTMVRAPAAGEEFYLRESLAHGGPVGEFLTPKGGKEARFLSRRFSGSVKLRTLSVLAETAWNRGDGIEFHP